jgi:hypothetical protein
VSRQARWARFGRRRELRSEQVPSADRPRGHKVGRLVVDPRAGDGSFLGLTVGGLYRSDDGATCEVLEGRLPPPRRWGRRVVPPPHGVPELGCSCGFYAFKEERAAVKLLSERPPVSRLFGAALLDVDLAGTVIEFERGFRANRQRVLGVQVPRWCVPCAADGDAQRAERVAGDAGHRLEAGLRTEVPRVPSVYRLAVAVHHASLLERLAGRAAMRPVCDRHTPPYDGVGNSAAGNSAAGSSAAGSSAAGSSAAGSSAEVVVLELAELAGRLATEVRWLEDDRFDHRGFIEALSWLPAVHRPST